MLFRSVYLVTKETLKDRTVSFGKEEMDAYLAEMEDGRHYAFISTPDFPDYVELAFTLEDIYNRWLAEKQMFAEGRIPERSYKRFYDQEDVDFLVSIGELSKTAQENFKKDRDKPGHFLCQSYCEFRDFCYTRQGTPRKEADLVGVRNESK